MDQLRLAALDEQDLEIISAHVQDAVLKVGTMQWLPAQKRFVMEMRRFVWEKKPKLFSRHYERRLAALSFDRVMAAKVSGFSLDKADDVLSLLALRFVPTQAPAGHVDLVFSAGAAVRLDVECIEARLADLGPAWQTDARPQHRG